MPRVAAVTNRLKEQWIGNHFIYTGINIGWVWKCSICYEVRLYKAHFMGFACEPTYQPEKPTAPKHTPRAIKVAQPNGVDERGWECEYCGAEARTEYLLNMVACDPMEGARIPLDESRAVNGHRIESAGDHYSCVECLCNRVSPAGFLDFQCDPPQQPEDTRIHTGPEKPLLVIIESPYAGDIETNVRYTRAALRDSVTRGEAPIASHLLYTQEGVLRDDNPEERQLGIEAGLAWGRVADRTAVYLDLGISRGMRLGINRAISAGRDVDFRRLVGWVK